MLHIKGPVTLLSDEIEMQAIRASGSGGQHVNKVSTAVHLRFDIHASSLPEDYKAKLLAWDDQRVTDEGIVVIKAQTYRSRAKNKKDALGRLKDLILAATFVPKRRVATRPSRNSTKRRLNSKARHAVTKQLRGRVNRDEH